MSAAAAVSLHRFELAAPWHASLGVLWLHIDQPAADRQFYCLWEESTDRLKVLEWWTSDCEMRGPEELEPGAVEALRDFCRASDEVIDLVRKHRAE